MQFLTHTKAAATNTPTLVRAGAGNVWDLEASNPNQDEDLFIQFYDAASTGDVTIGTNVKQAFLLPGGSSTKRGGFTKEFGARFSFELGIVYVLSKTPNTDSAPTAGATMNLIHS